jgi:hypothetical protein
MLIYGKWHGIPSGLSKSKLAAPVMHVRRYRSQDEASVWPGAAVVIIVDGI